MTKVINAWLFLVRVMRRVDHTLKVSSKKERRNYLSVGDAEAVSVSSKSRVKICSY